MLLNRIYDFCSSKATRRRRADMNDATDVASLSAPVVRTLDDAFNWASFHLSVIRDDALQLAKRWSVSGPCRATITSAFSGIGAPEQAQTTLAAVLHERFPDLGVQPPKNLAAIEWNSFSRNTLLGGVHKPDHCFCDVCGFINEKVRKQILEAFGWRLCLESVGLSAGRIFQE